MKIKNLKLRIVKKIHDKTEYILNTTKQDRRKDRRARRAELRKTRMSHLANWKPFNWGYIRKMGHRDYVVDPLPE